MGQSRDGSTFIAAIQPEIRTTTFLIPNLHCPSCVSNIESSLFALHPKPISASYSIISHSITVHHDPSLLVPHISRALEAAGFEVFSVIQDSSTDSSRLIVDLSNEAIHNKPAQRLEPAVERWRIPGGHARDKEEGEKKKKKNRERHAELCSMCQAEEKEKAESSHALTDISQDKADRRDAEVRAKKDDASEGALTNDPFVVIHSTFPSLKRFRAALSIAGMTCSSCVGKITKALQEKPWVISVSVSLLTSSASVTFEGEEHLKDVVNTIEEVGYEAAVEEVEGVSAPGESGPRLTSDVWRAMYAIGGMTCSACVGNITVALKNHDWMKTVDVNLISNSATVVFEGKNHLEEIGKTIEAVGYEVTLDDVVEFDQIGHEDLRRRVAIRVDGMYCDHCPSRVLDALEEFDQRITIEKPLTKDAPILTMAYVPHSPDFTIRHILASISANDLAFKASIYHPPTMEERSRVMHAREQKRIMLRVILSVIVAIPTFILGILLRSLVSSNNPSHKFLTGSMWAGQVSRVEWALFIMATPVYFLAADLFHRRALKELRAMWRPGSKTPILQRFYRFGSMDMLMSLGTSIAYFSSIVELAITATRPSGLAPTNTRSSYFDSVVFLAMFLLIGRLIEAYSKAKTGDAVTMLGKLRPTEAILVDYDVGDSQDHDPYSGQRTRHINVDLLEFRDVVRVLHGGSPPCDGIVLEGESKFDESSLTGESRLVGKSVGDQVFSGTVNEDGPISVLITSVSGTSMLDQIVKAVREGQTRRAPIERIADILTSYFVPFITLIAVSTWIVWLALGVSGALPKGYLDIDAGGWPLWSLQFAISVFVVACPCGIGLAAPTALFVGGGLAAQHGILVKGGGEAFQEASDLDCVVFDKTGTLTQGGEPMITDYDFASHEDEKMVLSMIKRLEENSSHPVAKAVVSFCTSKETLDVEVKRMKEIPGKGMKGHFTIDTMKGQDVELIIGNEALLVDHEINIPNEIIKTLDTWKAQGKSIALAATRNVPRDNPALGTRAATSTAWTLSALLAASDPLRPEAAAIVMALRSRGIEVWMISGDNPMTANAVGDMVGISREHIIAGVLPDQKAEKIRYLQKSRKKSKSRSVLGRKHEYTQKRATIAMIGDGINDAPALTMADVGVAIGSGSDIAISSAEFVLVSSNLTSLLTLIDLSRIVFTRIKFNFAWALVYNLIGVPVAAGVLFPVKSRGAHIRLDPVWASLAMALSSVSVVCSSLLLRSRLPGVGFRPENEIRQQENEE